MRDYSCHTVSFIINAFEKSVNFPFKYGVNGKLLKLLRSIYSAVKSCVTCSALEVHHICIKMVINSSTCSAHHMHKCVILSSISTIPKHAHFKSVLTHVQ